MKTKLEQITREVHIWAVPKYEFELEHPDYDGVPFRYKVYGEGYSPYQTGAVKVLTTEVDLTIPAGIDLVKKAVEPIEERMETLTQNFEKEMSDLRAKIQLLQLLEAPV